MPVLLDAQTRKTPEISSESDACPLPLLRDALIHKLLRADLLAAAERRAAVLDQILTEINRRTEAEQ